MAKRLVPFFYYFYSPAFNRNETRKVVGSILQSSFGQTGASFLMKEGDFFDSFIKRWKSYLLSQEKIN